ncbi:head-tail adaptor protein [Tropicibacter naphthalenivorans]|uniref:Bacteriophage head-tail adaptor n=1 Tax=Tropicibacter naphthalenivorans TaxID=441103 RepID=A0A0P1GED4_9RHOB|nr:head-tail adaptor protein [Tropicibacter naphthalenivorans]CUH80186.1 Bacteriophage head-tail adaptor [Tropicibacter naphthalenivorans]SMC85455.1 head-tail adaptor [Tropicibacter naphthalenivorans]
MSTPRLNQELVLEAALRVPDGAGGYDESWSGLGTLWGEVSPRSGRLTGGEEVTLSSYSHKITVRAAPMGASNRPVPGQRFVQGTRVFRIDAVTEETSRGLYLICQCQEEVAV